MVELLPTVRNEVLPKGLKRNKLMPLASFDDYPAVLERNRRRIFKLSKLTTTENGYGTTGKIGAGGQSGKNDGPLFEIEMVRTKTVTPMQGARSFREFIVGRYEGWAREMVMTQGFGSRATKL